MPSAPVTAASPLKETVPAETADCARMPTETQKSECLRQHPYTGHDLLPDEKHKPERRQRATRGQNSLIPTIPEGELSRRWILISP